MKAHFQTMARYNRWANTRLYDAVGNERLVDLIFANWELIKQARSASTVVPEHGKAWIANSIKRHKHILAALKKGGEEAACAAVFANIDSSEREIVARLQDHAREFDCILVSDQAETETPGVVTATVRDELARARMSARWSRLPSTTNRLPAATAGSAGKSVYAPNWYQ